MRRISRAAVLVALIALPMGCEDPSGPESEGTFTAMWADEEWSGDGVASLIGNVLHIAGSKKQPGQDYTAEFVSFEITSPAVGTFSLGSGKATYAELVGGDVYGALYRTTPEATGSVTITRYDGPGGLVEGFVSFDAELVAGSGTYGDRNRLEDGQFSVPVRQPLD